MRRFLSNILSLMAGNVFTLIVTTLFSLVLVTRLSNEEIGLQGAIVAFANMVMLLAYLGLFPVMLRELANRTADEQSRIYKSIFSLMMVLMTVACILAAGLALILNSFPGQQFTVLLLGLFVLVMSYAPIAPTEALLMVRGEMWRVAIIQSGYAMWVSLAGIMILLYGGGVGPIYIALALLSCVEIVIYLREVFRMIPGGPRFVFQPQEWLYYLKLALPSGLGSFFVMATRSLGTYLVYTFASEVAAGYLYLSYQLVYAVIMVVWVPYSVSILPVMTQLYAERQDKFAWLSSRSLIWLLAATLPVAVGGTVLAPNLLRLLGPSKEPAASTLQVFIWTLVFSVLVEFFARMMLVINRQRIYVVAAAAGAVLNSIFCVLLIGNWFSVGAAIASVIGTAAIALTCGVELRKWLFSHIHLFDFIRLLAALAGMVAGVQLVGSLAISNGPLLLILQILSGAVVYGLLVLILGVFRIEDWTTARSLFKSQAVVDASATV